MEQEFMTTEDVGVHARSKKELFRFIQNKGGVYLPPIEQCNYEFIRGIISGDKKVCWVFIHFIMI
jgi:hypothetical protein